MAAQASPRQPPPHAQRSRSLREVDEEEDGGGYAGDTAATDDEATPLINGPRRRSRRSIKQVASDRPKLVLRGLVALLLLLFIGLLVLLLTVPPQPRSTPPLDSRGRLNPPHLAKGSHGGVSAENGVCSQIGVDLMKRGGSAADAAVGAALCVGTVNMFSSGIGGGGFALIRAPTSDESTTDSEHIVVDFRETAPRAAYPEMYHNRPDLPKVGGLAVGVPGELRGLEEIWKRWGKLPWSEVVAPNVALAQEAKVGRELARRLQLYGSFIPDKAEWQEMFMNASTGQFLKEGDTIRREAYARTLQAVADQGSRVFYEGPIAQAMVEKVQASGGILTMQDLKEYSIEVRNAVRGQWVRGKRAWTTPMPTSGTVLLQMMNVLRLLGFEEYAEGWWRGHDGHAGPSVAKRGLWTHRLVEVMKHAYASRTRLGDPAFLNTTSLLEASKVPTLHRAKEIVARIDDDHTHPLEYYDPLFDIVKDHGTTHVSAVDSTGLAVGITSTINLIFGSQEMDSHTGVIFNDEMDDTSTPGEPNGFGLWPSPFNYPEPRKRPLSSISPLIIEDAEGRFELLLGGAGGSMIPTSILQTLLNLEKGYDLSEAVEELRVHHQLLPQNLLIERSVVSDQDEVQQGVKAQLAKRGHEFWDVDVNACLAVVQAVQWVRGGAHGDEQQIRAASDSRKNGWAEAW